MPDEKNTPPLSEEEEIAMAEGQSISYQWMRRHAHDYTPSATNAGILTAWLKKNKPDDFSVDALEEAFAATREYLETVAVKVAPTQTEKADLPEWGILTKKRIAEMPRADYKRFSKNPKFTEDVDAVLQGKQ